MTSADKPTYAAIIQIKLPGMTAPETLRIALMPPDLVAVGADAQKPLGECTLAELAVYADALESELWAAYREQSLRELAATEEVALQITLLDGDAEQGQEQELTTAAAEDRPMQAGIEGAAQAIGDESDLIPGGEGAPAALPGESAAEAAGAAAQTPIDETVVDEEANGAAGDVVAGDTAEGAEPSQAAEMVSAPPGEEVAVTGVVPEDAAEAAMAPAVVAPPQKKVRIAGLRRPQGHPTPAAADILINEPAFRDTQAHALSSLDREVAGMLVGPPPEKQPDGRYVVHVSDVIIAKHTRMHGASVTYTPESWRYVTDKLHERYPNEEAVIVGWYHTHPGFGIFLSGMDLFIHQNFFTQKWHIALVLDPHARKSGFFCWDRAQTAVQPYEFPWPSWAAGSW
jgi:proteasome lid subunit RPN8/RPN11